MWESSPRSRGLAGLPSPGRRRARVGPSLVTLFPGQPPSRVALPPRRRESWPGYHCRDATRSAADLVLGQLPRNCAISPLNAALNEATFRGIDYVDARDEVRLLVDVCPLPAEGRWMPIRDACSSSVPTPHRGR